MRRRVMWLDLVQFCTNKFIAKGMQIPFFSALEVSLWDPVGDYLYGRNSFVIYLYDWIPTFNFFFFFWFVSERECKKMSILEI